MDESHMHSRSAKSIAMSRGGGSGRISSAIPLHSPQILLARAHGRQDRSPLGRRCSAGEESRESPGIPAILRPTPGPGAARTIRRSLRVRLPEDDAVTARSAVSAGFPRKAEGREVTQEQHVQASHASQLPMAQRGGTATAVPGETPQSPDTLQDFPATLHCMPPSRRRSAHSGKPPPHNLHLELKNPCLRS